MKQALHETRLELARWYKKHGRHALPWRETEDAYAIWVSEIMLQQTQVKTVLGRYYAPFMKKFPTVAALAKAKESEVMKAWEGLGYYTRARNLHKAAKIIVTKYNARMPNDLAALLSLPGIGQNTAHAILAFAFHQPVAVMEANVKRVICRAFALLNPTPAELWEKATALLNIKNPFDHNQAMMDIGATVCTKQKPKCTQCPLASVCKGKKSPEHFPRAKKKKAIPTLNRVIVLFVNAAGKIYSEKREGTFLGGLYGFKEYEKGKPVIFQNKIYRVRKQRLSKPEGNGPAPTQPPPQAGEELSLLGIITHSYSHFTLQAEVYSAAFKGSGKNWHSRKAFATLALSEADRKVLRLYP